MNARSYFLVTVVLAVTALGGAGAGAATSGDRPSGPGTRNLTVTREPEDQISGPPIIDRLAPETVLRVEASGFDPDTTGGVMQCVQSRSRRCRNHLPVRFDDNGAATFQYLVTDRIGSAAGEDDRCRLREARCTIEIFLGDETTVVDTLFVDAAPPPGRLDVSPREGLEPGDTVAVRAQGLPPGAVVTVLVCADPPTRRSRCGTPGPVASLTIGRDGSGTGRFVLDVAAVGTDRVACGRRVTCRVVAVSDRLGVRAPPVPLSFRDSPDARYAGPRVVAGLTVAVGLLLLAGWLVRSTEWSAPREADSTAIDQAEYADLDQEAAEFDEAEATTSGTT